MVIAEGGGDGLPKSCCLSATALLLREEGRGVGRVTTIPAPPLRVPAVAEPSV